jgi:thiamine biosynthesis lipoprotein
VPTFKAYQVRHTQVTVGIHRCRERSHKLVCKAREYSGRVNHLRRQFPVWGTIVDVDCFSQSVGGADLDRAMETVIEFCEDVDRDFSTYKDGSWVSRLRRGEIAIADCPDDVRDVWDLCLRAKDLSDGAFDPWAVAGGFDPSGLVKGWAAVAAADILVAAGVGHVQVNAAGDLALRGGWFDSAAGVVKPWSIGVVNTDNRSEIVKVYEITDGAIATSGTYERGAHIHDPLNGLIAIGAKSATVVGAEGWLCDAMATAVMVAGQDGAKWFGQPQLAGCQVFAVNRHEQTAWSI